MEKEKEAQEQRRQFRLRSKAIQKQLPRPKIINKKIYNQRLRAKQRKIKLKKAQINQMINTELTALLQRDAVYFPFKGCKIPKHKPNLVNYTEEEL